jgi:coronin-1B/1C/6
MKTISNLQGHHKKVTLVKFNPTAANVLASTAADASVKIWDIERGEELSSCEAEAGT